MRAIDLDGGLIRRPDPDPEPAPARPRALVAAPSEGLGPRDALFNYRGEQIGRVHAISVTATVDALMTAQIEVYLTSYEAVQVMFEPDRTASNQPSRRPDRVIR